MTIGPTQPPAATGPKRCTQPFREFVLKVHQLCNLACDYCYVYTKADQTWRERPALMPDDVRDAAVRRIADHVRAHRISPVWVVLHGGEPMLAGTRWLVDLAADLRRAIGADIDLRLRMQSNGTLLTASAIRALAAAGVVIGISVDGPPRTHDSHRRFADGRPSSARVARAVALLHDIAPRAFGGLLATTDVRTDPVECYESLIALRPPMIDFLLPHANWDTPPPRPDPAGPAYGRWLIAVFDRWYAAAVPEVRVGLFESLIALALGGRSRSDQVGLSPAAVVVIESDGAVEQIDSLKSAYQGAAATPWNVLRDPLDEALDHPAFVARQAGLAALGPTCSGCSIKRMCGGGHYSHRYRAGHGFTNPSVYCNDLRILIDHVSARVRADLARAQ